MDDVNRNINKIVYDKNNSNLRAKFSLRNDATDSEDEKTRNLNPSLVYRDNIIKSLQDLKNKNNFNKEDFAFKPKFKIHNASIREDLNFQNELEMSNHEIKPSKTNYRTVCDSEQVKKLITTSPCRQSKMNINRFLSVSRQSLNDNESGITNTASRISANLSSEISENPEKLNPFHQSNMSSFSKSYFMKSRRFRTVVKQDNFSSYLTRTASDENLFINPVIGCSNVTFNLNDESNKRLDFSYISKIVDSPSSKVAKQSKTENNWVCNNCNSSNPSNFNFCPTCSESNPKLSSNNENKRRPQPIIDDEHDNNIWICSRCATKNENIRSVCIFCFRNKNETTKRQKLDAGIQVNVTIQCESKGNAGTGSDIALKWNCNECWATNEIEREQCACCYADKNPSNSSDRPKEASKLIFNPINTKQSCGFDFVSTQSATNITASSFVFGSENEKFNKKNSQESLMENKAIDKGEYVSKPPGIQSSIIFGSTIKFGSSNVQSEINESKFIFGQSKDLGKVFDNSGEKWNCPECWVENTPDRLKCACCSAKNPSVASSHSNVSTTFKFGQSKLDIEEMQTENDKCVKKWNCSECLVENEADKGECACCSAKNPNGITGTKKSSIFGSAIKFGSSNVQSEINESKFIFGQSKVLGKGFDNSDKKWNCSECLIENTPDRLECACCSAKNPNGTTGNQQSSVFGSDIKFGSSNVQPEINESKFIFGQSNSDKKWNCPECWVENAPDRGECACCSAKNPSVASTNSNVSTTFKFGQSKLDKEEMQTENDKYDKKWNCPECWVENAPDRGECACCSAKNPNVTTGPQQSFVFGSSNVQSKEIYKPKFVFGSAKSVTETKNKKMAVAVENNKSDKKWNCSECWAENAADKRECACCSVKNPSVPINHSNEEITCGGVSNNEISTDGLFDNHNIDRTQSVPDNSIQHKNWECPTCLLGNAESEPCCVCCKTSSPIATDNNISQTVGTNETKVSKPIFQFGSSGSVAINGIGNYRGKTNASQLPFQFGKQTNQQSSPTALTSNTNSDWPVFKFSSPKYLEVSVCSNDEPVDLVFEFASPVKF